ncbi:MAG TPA: hypothetical protein VNQ32_15775 [Steroidobacteraceae bacterium]|nr:hypothetical protein [Steroidobacteraceae bacterium]
MRRVACFVASSAIASGETPTAVIDSLLVHVKAWLAAKGLAEWSEGRSIVPRGPRNAVATITQTRVGDDVEWEVMYDEPGDGRRFLTRLLLGVRSGAVHLFLEMRAGAEGYYLAPVHFEVRTPRIVGQLLGARHWLVGETMASAKPIPWHGHAAGAKLWKVIRHNQRNLPVIAVSRFQGQALTPTLATDLARELGALAVVADLDDAASWSLTEAAGKEWSCFNGAIRLYWPLRAGATSFRDCPLWTMDRLREAAGTPEVAAERIRAQLRRWLFELSTYAVDEPSELFALRRDASHAALQAAKAKAAEEGDYKSLAEELFDRCDGLEKKLATERQKAEDLQAQVTSLEQVWRYQDYGTQAVAGDIAPDTDSPPETIAEAVGRARALYTDLLVFGEDVDGSVAEVAADAGPPAKILRCLDVLADMTRARRNGGLGKDPLGWLRDQGVPCSGEGEFVNGNPAEKTRRTWRDGAGGRRYFDLHLKPAEGTSPDRCVRIYFGYDETARTTVVAHVGRHP